MRIEFDEAKRTATLKARELDMARADEVFAGATLTVEDDRRDYGEVRYITTAFWTKRWWYLCGHAATTHTGSSA